MFPLPLSLLHMHDAGGWNVSLKQHVRGGQNEVIDAAMEMIGHGVKSANGKGPFTTSIYVSLV